MSAQLSSDGIAHTLGQVAPLGHAARRGAGAGVAGLQIAANLPQECRSSIQHAQRLRARVAPDRRMARRLSNGPVPM